MSTISPALTSALPSLRAHPGSSRLRGLRSHSALGRTFQNEETKTAFQGPVCGFFHSVLKGRWPYLGICFGSCASGGLHWAAYQYLLSVSIYTLCIDTATISTDIELQLWNRALRNVIKLRFQGAQIGPLHRGRLGHRRTLPS